MPILSGKRLQCSEESFHETQNTINFNLASCNQLSYNDDHMWGVESMKKITEDAIISIINNRTMVILNTVNIQNISKDIAVDNYSLTARLQDDTFKRILNNETIK